MDHLPSSYPLPKVYDQRVFFLDLNAFEAMRKAKTNQEVTEVSLKAKNARISAPIDSIRTGCWIMFHSFNRIFFAQICLSKTKLGWFIWHLISKGTTSKTFTSNLRHTG